MIPFAAKDIPHYVAGAQALFGLASSALGSTQQRAGSPPAGSQPAQQVPSVLPDFVKSSFIAMSPMQMALIGGVVFLSVVTFDTVRRVRRLEKRLEALGEMP